MPELSTGSPSTLVRAALPVAAVAAGLAIASFPRFAGVGIAAAILLLGRAAEIDSTTHRIPNRLLGATAVALFATAATLSLAALVAGAIIAAAWLLTLLVLHVADPRLGFGDVKLGGVLGAMVGLSCHSVGWNVAQAALLSSAAFVAGAVLTLVAATGRRPDQPVPFAPGLVIAVVTITVTLGIAT